MRIAILAAALLGAFACTTQTDVPAPSTYIAAKHPSAVWVETKYPTVRLEHPEVIGDSIIGLRDGRPFSVALSEVAGVTVRQIDWPVTDALLATGGVALAVALVKLISTNPTPCAEVPCPSFDQMCGCR
jgi:hypothetical protein